MGVITYAWIVEPTESKTPLQKDYFMDTLSDAINLQNALQILEVPTDLRLSCTNKDGLRITAPLVEYKDMPHSFPPKECDVRRLVVPCRYVKAWGSYKIGRKADTILEMDRREEHQRTLHLQ